MTTFDEALPLMIDVVAEQWGRDAVAHNLFLRDAIGRLTLIVLDDGKTGAEREALSTILNDRIGPYADPSGISVATPEELFDASLRQDGIGLAVPIEQAKFEGFVRILDRRVVGADWLRRPETDYPKVPRLFFVSLKGGVGRSTALCVLAAHFAAHGRRVLAIDMDLEAPGLGSMLLDANTLPRFGLLDYLVETNLIMVSDGFLTDMQGYSPLSGGRGSITVVPAWGALAADRPVNVLSKLARAYLPSDNDQSLDGFAAKIDRLIDRLTASGDHDVVLIDARAGMHESTAAAAVALQGDTLVFGMDQPQTYGGYRAFLAQLALTLGPDWATRIHIVEAKVGGDGPSDEFIANMTDILTESENPEPVGSIPIQELRTTFAVEWDDELSTDTVESVIRKDIDSTHIYESGLFTRFDPLKYPDRLTQGMYAAVFGDFLQTCDNIVKSAESIEGRS